jgi:photosystem II stability/assembly factor-like uncharacterized protein
MSRYSLSILLLTVMAFSAASQANDDKVHQPKLASQNSGTANLLIAVSPVDSRVVWAAGINGTFDLTTDGGKTWKPGVVKGAETLEFRDVQGVSDKVAYLLSISPTGTVPTEFRIYKTVDGGKNWTIEFENQLANAFYDCFAFWTPDRGLAHSDSVNGVFPELRTLNGKTWQSIANRMPPALPGEASFAASGTCVATQGEGNAWIATGGTTEARILATRDGGDTWNAYDTPLVSGPAAGAFSVQFRDGWHGIVGGGDLDPTDPNNARTAISGDGGRTWTLTNAPPVTGAIFGLAYASDVGLLQHGDQWGWGDWKGDDDDSRTVVITADTGGAAWTPDEGKTWYPLSSVTGYWAVAFADRDSGWLVGENGTILKISF